MIEITKNEGTGVFSRFVHIVYHSLVVLQTTLLGVLLICVVLQISTRKIPAMPHMLWTEEIARFLLIWVIFLGAAIGVKEGSHFTVSLLPEPKNRKAALIWDVVVYILIIVFSAIFLYRGYKYAMGMSWDISDVAQISMLWVATAIPVFGFLSLLFGIDMIITRIKKEFSES